MNRRPLIIVIGLVLVAGASVIINLVRLQPEGPEPAATVEAPARPVIQEAPRPETSAPEPRVARRAPAPSAAAAPSAAPTPAAAAPEVGTLHIDSDVAGAQVFIDREYIGATPVTAPNIKPGVHNLNLSAQGYDGIAETIDVSPGQRDILIKLKEVRLDAKIDVVHKHRFGSCKGELIATPRGLRYETSDKSDSFSAGLLDLDKFEVDYLKKNLNVKLNKGRDYSFTDPEGNADQLFVFHRDVEKARDRLKRGDPPASQ